MKDTAVDMVVVNGEQHTNVLLSGEMDRLSAPGVQRRLRDLVLVTNRPLVIDLAGISFFDAAGLRAISTLARFCDERGTGLAVTGARPFTAKMFRVLRMHERIPLCESEKEALCCLIPPTDADIEAWLDG